LPISRQKPGKIFLIKFHGKNALGKSGIGTILAQRQNASPEVSERKSAAD